ncbi:MAG: hypothetical protein QMC80_02215 [Thermoplasmatales archaeon]|nr:hypothetical protein [Thermoplasmatales archaeon]
MGYGAGGYRSFQKRLFGYTEADYCFYFLDVRKPAVFGLGKEKLVNVVISPLKLVLPNEEKVDSSEILRILQEDLKIQEKVKLIPYENFIQAKGRAYHADV